MLKRLSNEPGDSRGEYFVWSAQERPVSVHLSLSTVNALDAHVRGTLGTLPKRGLEVGGLLVGRVKNPNPGQYIVSVERFEQLEIKHLRGPSYILSVADRDELSHRLRKFAKNKDGLSVVGFYRSHTRPGLYLDEYDFDLLRSYFPHPSSVALLARPVHDGPATAGFFIWEDGEIHRARTYREFPLSAELLSSPQPDERPDESAPVASPLPAIEAESPEPHADFTVPDVTTVRKDLIPKLVVMPAAVPAPVQAPVQSRGDSDGALKNPFVVWTAVAAAALIAAAAIWQPREPEQRRAHNVLSLNAEVSQSGLRLTWDRTNPLIAQHRTATLSITDGAEEKQVTLDAAQLKTGALVYWPTSRDVNFRLQLGGFSESLRAIAPQLPPKPQVETPQPETVLASVPAQLPVQQPAQPPVQPPAQELKPAATPSAARQVRPAILPPDRESPKTKPQELPPPPSIELARVPARPDNPIAAERNTSPPPVFADIEQVRGSGFKRAVGAIPALLLGKGRDQNDFVPAKPVRQVNPNLAASVKLPTDTRVSVRVSLDQTGRVKGTDLVTRNVDTRLANAAMDAARRWRFQPARQQRKPVESSVILHFKFNREGDGS